MPKKKSNRPNRSTERLKAELAFLASLEPSDLCIDLELKNLAMVYGVPKKELSQLVDMIRSPKGPPRIMSMAELMAYEELPESLPQPHPLEM
jgi:hypothetical protein